MVQAWLVTSFCALLLTVTAQTDFYKLLSIQRDADNREIRKAFKKLALQLHPDKNTVSYLCNHALHSQRIQCVCNV